MQQGHGHHYCSQKKTLQSLLRSKELVERKFFSRIQAQGRLIDEKRKGEGERH
jgi:hypothetical protein